MTTTTETTMETQGDGQESFERVRSAIDQARTEMSDAVGYVPAMVDEARDRAGQVAERLPGAFSSMRSGAESGVTRLQTMPESALRLLAAVSIGQGAGLRLAGAPRLVTLAGFAPASIMGFAIMTRPRPAPLAPHQA